LAILGAGLSGLTTASRVASEWPDKKVVILEPRDRIGGRVFTDNIAGVKVDLGASWLHDLSSDNPLADYVRKSGVKTKVSDWDYEEGAGWDLAPDWSDEVDLPEETGEYVPPPARRMGREEMKNLSKDYDEFVNALNERREVLFNASDAEDQPLSTLIDEAKSRLKYEDGSKRSLWLDEMIYSAVEEVEAAGTDELSALFFDEVDVDVNGGVNLLFPDGAGGLLEGLDKGLDIRTGVEVINVSYDPEAGFATLTTAKGDKITATQVVCTVPLGVLKTNRVTFQPDLPKRLKASIAALGFGTLDKIVLIFPRGALSKIIAKKEEVLHLHHDYDESDPFRIVELFNLAKWNEDAEGLIGFVAGQDAKSMERLEDPEAVKWVMAKLKRIDAELVEPTEVRITRWVLCLDELARKDCC
jgi:hypothetical protein